MPDSPTAARPSAALRSASLDAPLDRLGLAAGIGAYVLWGVLPLYFPLLQPAGAVEIIANRVVWSLLFCVLLLGVTRTWGAFVAALRHRRTLGLLSIAAVLLAVNWLVFVFGILTDRVVDAALGYYINPLVTVTLAVVVLRERLRAGAVGGPRLRRRRRRRHHRRLRAAAVDRAGPRAQLRVLRPDQEPGRPQRRRRAGPRRRDPRARPARARLPGLDQRDRDRDVRHRGRRARADPRVVGRRHRHPAAALQLRRPTAAAVDARAAAVHRARRCSSSSASSCWASRCRAARWWGFGLVWVALALLTVDGIRNGRAQRLGRRAAEVSAG